MTNEELIARLEAWRSVSGPWWLFQAAKVIIPKLESQIATTKDQADE